MLSDATGLRHARLQRIPGIEERDARGIRKRDPLHDPEWREGEAPHEIGRRRFGRIAIANSDAGAKAYLDCAVDQAHRAVQELVQSS